MQTKIRETSPQTRRKGFALENNIDVTRLAALIALSQHSDFQIWTPKIIDCQNGKTWIAQMFETPNSLCVRVESLRKKDLKLYMLLFKL